MPGTNWQRRFQRRTEVTVKRPGKSRGAAWAVGGAQRDYLGVAGSAGSCWIKCGTRVSAWYTVGRHFTS